MKKLTTLLIGLFIVVAGIHMMAEPGSALDEESAFKFPVRAYNDGNYRVAIRGFNEYLGNFPDSPKVPRIKFWKAEALLHLEEYKDAYDVLLRLHKNKPEFEAKKVLHRLAFLAGELDRRDEVLELFNTDKLQRVPRLQNYLVKWRLARDQKQELYSRLSLLPENKLTETAREFLAHQHQGQVVRELEQELGRGTWNPSVRRKLSDLPEPTRRNLLVLGAKELWNKEELATLVNLGKVVPDKWQSTEFKLYYAEAAVNTGQHDLAEETYQKLRGADEYQAQVSYSLGWLLYRQQKYEEAKEILQGLDWEASLGEISPRAERMLGNILLQEQQLSAAQGAYKRAIDLSDSPVFRNQTRFWLGWSYFEADMLRDAYQQFNRVSADEQIGFVDVYQVRGRTALGLGKYTEAEENYNKALKFADSSERTARLKYELAQVYYEWGRVKTAFNILLKLNRRSLPEDLQAPVKFALGRTALENNKAELAWSVLKGHRQQLLEHYPVEYRYFAGDAALRLEYYGRARKYFEEILEEYPTSPFTRPAARMSFRVELEQIDPGSEEQRQRIRQKIEQSPPEMRVSMLREWAETLFERGDYDQARALYEEVLLKSDRPSVKAEATGQIVQIYQQQGHLEKALAYMDKQFEELPVHPEAANAIYQLLADLYDQRRLEDLETWSGRYLEKFPESRYHGQVHFMLGELHRARQEFATAKQSYQQAMDQALTETLKLRARYRLAQIHLALENFRQANRFLNEVATANPDFVPREKLAGLRAEVAYELGEFERVLEFLDQLDSKSSAQQMLTAKVLFQLGKYPRAEELLLELEVPETSELRPARKFWLGRVAYKQGDLEAAEEHWYQTFYLFEEWEQRDRLIYYLIKLARERGENEEASKLRQRLEQEFPESSFLTEVKE